MSKKLVYLRIFIIIIGITGLLSIFPNALYRLRYYTYLSNALVVSFYTYLLMTKQQTARLYRLKACVTVMIALTFIVYNVLLLPKVSPHEFWQYRNFSLHYIVPILTMSDWFINDRFNHFNRLDPFYWAILPLCYCSVALTLGHVFQLPIPNEKQTPYPYFFLNIEKIGWQGFFTYCFAILIIYIIIGYSMIYIKRLQTRTKKPA